MCLSMIIFSVKGEILARFLQVFIIVVASLSLLNKPFFNYSLQFDPAPRRGEPHVTRRTPDYFL